MGSRLRLALALVLVTVACGGPQRGAPAASSSVTPKADARPKASSDAAPKARTVKGEDSASSGDPCTRDDECVVTNFPGCCACPQCSIGEPMARSREAQRRAAAECAAVKCNMRICAVAGMCLAGESADHFTPRCRKGRCVGARRVPP